MSDNKQENKFFVRKAKKVQSSAKSSKTGRKNEERIILPSPGKHQWFELPQEPFDFEQFLRFIYGPNINKSKVLNTNDNSIRRQKASELLRREKSAQARYLMYLCHIGALIQKAIKVLELQRRIEVDEVMKFVRLCGHPAFKIGKLYTNSSRVVNDETFPAWRTALADADFEVKTLLANFLAAYQLTVIPDYPEFPKT